jgi:endonuclease/exonuclease/phosphatase family metal-dependent hydrolase
MKYWFWLLLSVLACKVNAQVPVVGKDTLLEIATWNLEWFGDTQNGPNNETTQYNNIKRVLEETKIDIWGLQEVSNQTTWNTLLASSLNNKYMGYLATYSQTQKTALLYDKENFQVIPSLSGHVLTESQYNYSFASRPPLLVALQTKNRSVIDTLYVFVLHMKAYADQESYSRRVNASGFLKTYLDNNYAGKYWAVIGDLNDHLTTSIYSGSPSPYVNFSDTSKYFWVSKQLADAGKRSYAFSAGMIDHVMISAKLKKDWYINNSARVVDELPNIISGFSNNTTDHYPVLGLFDNRIKETPKPPDTPSTGLFNTQQVYFLLYPNPAKDKIFIQAETQIESIEVYSMEGKMVMQNTPLQESFVWEFNQALPQGIYTIKVKTNNGVGLRRLIIE